MVVNVILLQNAASIVVEVNAHLLPAVNTVASERGLTAGSDPDARQCIRMDLIAFNNATPIIMLQKKKKKKM